MESLTQKLDKVGITEHAEEALEDGELKWGMDLTELYKLSLKFYKGGDDKEFFCLREKFPMKNLNFQKNQTKLCI